MGRSFSNSFLAGEPASRGFLALDFREARDREAGVRQAAEARVAPEVLTVLREQNARLPQSAARDANLRALAEGRTAVVVTGQQVGLFLGPLYSFYKAASAVAYARRLQRETGVRCVPLFWLQTEDHDFDEIDHATVADGDGAPVVLRLRADAARTSVAQRVLGPEIDALVAALATALGPGAAAEETLALVRAHYRPGNGVAAAFAGVMAALFADEGLVFLDPRDARVAAASVPVYAAALAGAGAIEACLAQRRDALAAAGFDEQIAVRRDCALLFFHQGGVEGPRFRLERGAAGEGGWRLSGTGEKISDETVAEALARAPLRFSTSALLRPIIQDTLLPVAAYVGGPAEVSYLAQLPPAYAHFGVRAPLVIPRARFRCLAARARRLLDELGLSADDLARPEDELLARLPAHAPPGAPTPAALRARVAAEIAPVVEAIARDVEAADPQLGRAASRTRASVAHALARLTARYERTLVTREGTAVARLGRLRADLAPGGVPQERVYAWPSLAGRHGPKALTRLVLDTLDGAEPFPTRLLELRP